MNSIFRDSFLVPIVIGLITGSAFTFVAEVLDKRENSKIMMQIKNEKEKLTKNKEFMRLFDLEMKEEFKSFRDFDPKSLSELRFVSRQSLVLPFELATLLGSKKVAEIDWKDLIEEYPDKKEELLKLYELHGRILNLPKSEILWMRYLNLKRQEAIKNGEYSPELQKKLENFRKLRKRYFKRTNEVWSPLLNKRENTKMENRKRSAEAKAQRDRALEVKARRMKEMRKPHSRV